MKPLFIFLLSIILALPSFATIDPDPDQIGIYFDTSADITCIDMAPSVPFWAYVIITRPTSPEVHGVEFSLCEVVAPGLEGMFFRLNAVWANGGIDPSPVEIDWCTEGVIRGFGGQPVVPIQDNALLVSIQYMLLTPMSLEFHLGPCSAQSIEDGLPAYLGADGEIMPLGISSGDPDLPVASVNGCNVVPIQTANFGEVKCLFR